MGDAVLSAEAIVERAHRRAEQKELVALRRVASYLGQQLGESIAEVDANTIYNF